MKILSQVRLNTVKNSCCFFLIKGTYHPFLGFLTPWKTRVRLLDTLEGPFQVPHYDHPNSSGVSEEDSGPGRGQEPKHSPMPDEQPMVFTKDYRQGTPGELTSN